MISRFALVALASLLVAPAAVFAQNPVRDSMKGLFDVTRTVITATARELTPEHYAYRPTEEVRSAGQILAHIANAQFAFCSGAAGESSPMSENLEDTRTTKAGIVDALEQSFAYCEGVYGRITDAAGGESVSLFGSPNTRLGALAFNNAHNYEHYGNLVTYMRLNGIVPPSSR
jgi:uncharacterized damage-inducible protein DinB